MKTLFLSVLIAIGSLVLPAFSLAAMYQYVDVNGNIKDINATSSIEALVMPDDIAPHSGVIRVTEQTEIPEHIDVPL
jgi:hypothetical protein